MDVNLRRRRDLCRLILAKDSIEEALRAISITIETGARLHQPLYMALQSAVVVSYGRAFVEMKPLGNISANWSKFSDPVHRKTHDLLYEHRMTKIAHIEYAKGLVIINPPGALRTDGLEQVGFGFDVGFQFYTPEAYQAILGLCSFLVVEMYKAISDELVALFGPNESLKEPFDLLTQSDLEFLKGPRT